MITVGHGIDINEHREPRITGAKRGRTLGSFAVNGLVTASVNGNRVIWRLDGHLCRQCGWAKGTHIVFDYIEDTEDGSGLWLIVGKDTQGYPLILSHKRANSFRCYTKREPWFPERIGQFAAVNVQIVDCEDEEATKVLNLDLPRK